MLNGKSNSKLSDEIRLTVYAFQKIIDRRLPALRRLGRDWCPSPDDKEGPSLFYFECRP